MVGVCLTGLGVRERLPRRLPAVLKRFHLISYIRMCAWRLDPVEKLLRLVPNMGHRQNVLFGKLLELMRRLSGHPPGDPPVSEHALVQSFAAGYHHLTLLHSLI